MIWCLEAVACPEGTAAKPNGGHPAASPITESKDSTAGKLTIGPGRSEHDRQTRRRIRVTTKPQQRFQSCRIDVRLRRHILDAGSCLNSQINPKGIRE